jgi:fimbrial chaperone protein
MAGKTFTICKGAGIFLPALLFLAGPALSDAPAPVPTPQPAAFNVTPLRIELDSASQFQTFQVRNESQSRMAVQARVFMWGQKDGEDSFAPTTDIALSPSIVEIEPGAVQYFKLLRRTSDVGAAERSFRLVIDQLPSDNRLQAGVTNTRLRISLPVFANRDLAKPALLGWSSAGSLLQVSNAGGRSVKFGKLAILTADGVTHDLGLKGPRYVLSGASAAWALPPTLFCIPAGSVLTGTLDNAPLREPIQQSCG